MTEIEEDFIELLNDLEVKISEPNKYNNKKASGILRQLLVDNPSLLDQVNKTYNKKIKYIVRKLRQASPGVGNIIMEGIVPIKGESEDKHEILNRESFFKTRCLIYNEHLYTVLDIIKINANVRGGIHSGKAKTEKEIQAIEMVQTGSILTYKNGTPMDMTLAIINDIARIVINAFEELRNEINTKKRSNMN